MTDAPSTPPPPAAPPARHGPITYSVAELADALGCSERTVWRRHAAGELPAAVRIGRLVRWPRASIDRWLADGCPARPRKPSR